MIGGRFPKFNRCLVLLCQNEFFRAEMMISFIYISTRKKNNRKEVKNDCKDRK